MANNTKKRTKSAVSANNKKRRLSGVKINKKSLIAIILAAVCIIAAVGLIISRGTGTAKSATVDLEGDVAWGVDVSHHNGKIDWSKVKTKADFAIIRVGARGWADGNFITDKASSYNLKQANKYGVPAGAYFYSQATTKKEAEEEAEFIIKKVKAYNISLPLFIDYEYAIVNGEHAGRLLEANLGKKEKTDIINAFCDKIRKAGYIPGVYASTYLYESELNVNSIPDDVYIWVADYNGEITYDGYYDIWQYSDRGECAGINDNYVDLNYFYIKNRK